MRNDKKLILKKAEEELKFANNELEKAEKDKISGNIKEYYFDLNFAATSFGVAGDLYYIIEEYEKAKECFSKAVEFDIECIKIKKEMGDKDIENFPFIKYLLGSKNKELIDKYKSEIIKVYKKEMENLDLGGVFVDKIIEMLVYLGSPDIAKEYFEKALNSGEELPGGIIATCYFWLGEYEKAIPLFEEELKVKYDKDNIDELGKKIPNGEIDILLKDGTIVECKALYWPEQNIDELENRFKKQIEAFKAYDPTATIKFVFKDSVDPTIKTFLEGKGVIVE